MGALQNEQRVLRAAVEAELTSCKSACAAALDSSQASTRPNAVSGPCPHCSHLDWQGAC